MTTRFRELIRHRNIPTSILKQYLLINKNKRLGIGEIFSTSKLNKFKTSDTLFVMGSGPSICDYTDQQLSHIETHNSFGFTNWTMHELIPTYYMNEFKRHTEELRVCEDQELFNLVARRKDYENTALIFRAGSTDFSEIEPVKRYGFPFKNVFLAMDIGIIGATVKEFTSSFRLLKKFGLLGNPYIVLQKTASIFRIIMMAYKLGYKKIVLCGIDLTGDEYFFEREREQYSKNGLKFPKINAFRNQTHKTNDPKHSTGNMVISDVINTINELLLKPGEVVLYTGSKQGFFYPSLPLYEY